MRGESGLGGAAGEELSSARLARLVRDGRRAAGLTQLQLASAAGVSAGVIRDLEQGRTGQPRRQSVERITAVLGISLGASWPEPNGDAGQHADADMTAADTGLADGAGTATGQVRLQVLGSLTAWRDGMAVALGPARQRAVLALLAVQPNSLVRREAICEALWPGDPPATAVSMIQSYVGKLRRALDPAHAPGGSAGDSGGLLVAAGSGYQLQVTGEELDLIAFGQLCGQARTAVRAGQPAAACAFYEQALDLWQGEPLADVDALRGHPAVGGLARQRAEAVEDYADAASAQGWHGRVLAPSASRLTSGRTRG
jgi:transcriptional regulator with XRE-family HTH domain